MRYLQTFTLLLSVFAVHAQSLTEELVIQRNAPAVLSGYCDGNGGPLQGLFFGLGANHDTSCFNGLSAADTTGSQNTGLPMPSAGILRNLILVAYQPTSSPAPPAYQITVQLWVNSSPTPWRHNRHNDDRYAKYRWHYRDERSTRKAEVRYVMGMLVEFFGLTDLVPTATCLYLGVPVVCWFLVEARPATATLTTRVADHDQRL
jgi:hypothetical protein